MSFFSTLQKLICLFFVFTETSSVASGNVAGDGDWTRQTSVEDQLQVTREKMEQLRR